MPRLLAALLALAACAPAAPTFDTPAPATTEPTPAESVETVFVARLGADTVAVERVLRDAAGATVTLVTRVPATQRTTARIDLDDDGRMLAYEAAVADAAGRALRRVGMERAGDSLLVFVTADGAAARQALAAAPDVLPFVEYAHFPFDLALQRGATGALPMATERAVLAFTLERAGDSATIRHPFRGPMTATVGTGGRLEALDAGQTTRKLVVTRAPGLDVDAFERRAAALDAAGQGAGPLSGRAETVATVAGATIALDHGQPSLRGRDVWGSVVPFGQVWRTGADRATHLTTSRPLVLGHGASTVRIPVGTVTLFSVPEADGGVLIVSRETGQNGARYDPAQDVGRAPLALARLAAPVERLEVVAEPASGPDGADGRLAIRWGDRELSVPFTVE